ncbi:MAG TPA: hypothetical protein VN708_07330 [Terriglobales bacterium]|jgi:hypothetical protein|nr:hypothetical protein [Terriglobales bacterium]
MSTGMQGFERDTLSAVLSSKRVWLLHFIVNGMLMLAFFYWIRIPEETGWEFTLTVVGGLTIAFCALWLHCATFDYFSMASEQHFTSSLRRSLARIPAFLVWTIIFAAVLWLIGQLWAYDEQTGGYARHSLPLLLRKDIGPRSMFSAAHWGVWFLYFFLWPILFLPVGGQIAAMNFPGLWTAAAFRPIRRWRFWLAYLACFVVGAYIPYTLAWMIPRKPSSLGEQTWSMGLRLGFGYLLLVTAWVVLCAAIMRASGGEKAVTKTEPEPVPVSS